MSGNRLGQRRAISRQSGFEECSSRPQKRFWRHPLRWGPIQDRAPRRKRVPVRSRHFPASKARRTQRSARMRDTRRTGRSPEAALHPEWRCAPSFALEYRSKNAAGFLRKRNFVRRLRSEFADRLPQEVSDDRKSRDRRNPLRRMEAEGFGQHDDTENENRVHGPVF